MGWWSTHRPQPAQGEADASGPPFRTATVSRSHDREGPVRLLAVRTSEHDGYDRVEFSFDRALPSWRVGYTAAVLDGAGRRLTLPGRAFLEVTFRPTQAHDASGDSTFGPQTISRDQPSLRQVRLAGDLEGEVRLGLGLRARTAFRVLESSAPPRVTVDVRT